MKKAMKKLMAALLAVAMVCAMAIPAFADNAWETEEDLNEKHEYDAFQIFKGDVSEDNKKISNANWSESITHPEDFLESLKHAPIIGSQFSNAKTAQDVLAVISKWHDSDNDSIAFARFVCSYIYTDANADWKPVIQGGHTGGFEIQKPGYYLIVDTSPFSDGDSYHAYNSFMLTVSKAPYHVQIKYKVVKPTVKKEVYDNNDIGSTGDNYGWHSSADHAINEPFQFRLIAKLPASKDNGRAYDYYDKYTVCFNDTLSEGITFDRLDKVEITSGAGGTPKVINAANYTLTPNDPQSFFKLSIDNVKTCAVAAGFNLNDGATITVTYTAHLNDKAAVNSSDNKNSVRLQYSNNPRPGEHWGYTPNYTPESEVYVYTYQLNNTKRAENENGALLKGAGFRLYSADTCNATEEIKLKKNTDNTYSPYFGTDAGDEMFSDDKGQFNVKGLDAGTYYLKETTTPTGYNTCGVTTVTIKANHTGNRLDLNGSNLSTTIINNSGTTLPSTGGIGTTLFYVIGGGLMVAAAILLITKKRMENR